MIWARRQPFALAPYYTVQDPWRWFSIHWLGVEVHFSRQAIQQGEDNG